MNFFRRRQTQLQEEIEAHIAFEIEENLQAGMSPEEARRAATKKFGNTQLAVERSREIWGLLWLERLLQDLRYALRSLKKSPGYTATVILALALGLGATATILAVVDSVLLRPVAIPHPEQLVMLHNAGNGSELSDQQIESLRHHSHLLSAVNGYMVTAQPVKTAEETRMALLVKATPGLFGMLGIQAKQGRLFNSKDAGAPVVVINNAFWRTRLHSEPDVIGTSIRISGELRTIIGMLPRGIHFPNSVRAPLVYLPLSLDASNKSLFAGFASVIARMKPGVAMPQALAEAQSILANRHSENGIKAKHLAIQSYKNYLTGRMQEPLIALLGGVLLLLLIACANVANLQIVRAMKRMEEMHIRSALGASFVRLLQQLVTESVVVSSAGAVLGGASAEASVVAIRAAYGQEFARFNQLTVHPIVLMMLALLAIVVGILVSIAPAFNVRRQTMAGTMMQRTTPRTRISNGLVSLQIALTCVLLVVSGLFVRTFFALQHVKLGFNPHQVTTLVLAPNSRHMSPTLVRQTDASLLRHFKALPGVQSATLQSSLPFSNYNITLHGSTDVSTHPYRKGDSAYYSIVSSDFVHASGIHLLRGRGFLTQDNSSGAMVALVNQAFVHKFLAGHNPIGVTVKMHNGPGEKASSSPLSRSMRIVGVVQNELQGGTLGAAFQPMVYVDYMQLPEGAGFLDVFSLWSEFAIRSSLAQATLDKELRSTVKHEAPDMAEMQLKPMETSISQSLSQRRLALRIVSSFGVIALLLSAIGIYGVLAYAVTLRRKEIGIRMALGSSRSGVVQLVMKKAAWMVFFGVIPGLAGAWFAGRAVKSFLYGVIALDPITEASVAVALVLVAAIAASIPAWRAARVDPMEVLRTE